MSIEHDTPQPSTELADLMASDEYWDEPINPLDYLTGDNKSAYTSNQREAWRNTDIISTIGNTAFSLRGGGTRELLEEGSDYPEIPEDSRKVIRVVMDSRTTMCRGSKTSSLSKKAEKLQAEKFEGFDKMAESIVDPSTWWSYFPVRVKSAGFIKEYMLRRRLMYMRPNSEMNLGVCVYSYKVPDQSYAEEKRADEVIPMLPVGATFKFDGGIAKIAQADVLESEGVIWQDAPKKPPKDKSRARLLLPRLVLGS